MPEFNVYDQDKNVVSVINLSDGVFNTSVNQNTIYEVVKNQLANRRRGTASTKTKGFVSGGGRKPWRQKGTGRARAGSIRSPLWPGGGIIFGPHPRDYSYKVSKKVRKSALRSIFSQKFKENKLMVLNDINLNEIKTKKANAILKTLNLDNALIIMDKTNFNFEKSVRNIPKIKVMRVENLNAYDMLLYDKLVIMKGSVEKIEEILKQ